MHADARDAGIGGRHRGVEAALGERATRAAVIGGPAGLLHVAGRTLEMLDQERLEAFADFSPAYLSWR